MTTKEAEAEVSDEEAEAAEGQEGGASKRDKPQRLMIEMKLASYEAFIKAGKIVIADDRITPARFPLGTRTADADMLLVKIKRRGKGEKLYLNDKQVRAALADRTGELPNTIKPLLALAAQNAAVARSNWIVCHGVEIEDDDGNALTPYLTVINGTSYVCLHNGAIGWGPHCLFLMLAN